MGSDGTRILMLHRVLDDAPAAFGLPGCYRLRGTALTPQELALVLKGAGPVVALDAVERALELGDEPPRGTVLTFDDGYREHLEVVAPLLAERGVTATFYVATGLRGDANAVAAVDAWYWLLDHAEARVARVLLPSGGEVRGRVDTHEGKGAWVGGAPKAALLRATAAQQADMIASLAESVGCGLPADLASRLYLVPEGWRALVSLGMRVGAHSVSHPRLTQVDDDLLRAEVLGSMDALRRLGAPVTWAYPDGACDDRVVDMVRRAGASSAVTCEPGWVRRGVDRMRLPRVFVPPSAARRDQT